MIHMGKNHVNIAVIDDGVNEKLYNTGELDYNIEITPELDVKQRVGYDPFLPSHGTTCASIIKKYSPAAVPSSVKILNDSARGVRDQLVKAIEWCVEAGINLVNMSLGTIDYRDFDAIRKVVNFAYKNGIIIVAACNNKHIFTHPASLPWVIGVKCNKLGRLEEGEYKFNEYPADGIEITSCSTHLLTKHGGEEKTTSICNSFATPMITALVYDIMFENPGISLEGIKMKLRKGSLNKSEQEYYGYIARNMEWVERAAVFDLSPGKSLLDGSCYTFDASAVINIEGDNYSSQLDEVENYFADEKDKGISDIDTCIFVKSGLDEPWPNRAVQRLAENVARNDRNIVFAFDGCTEEQPPMLGGARRVKVWHPSSYRHFYKRAKKRKNIDIPFIIIYDFTGENVIKAGAKLIGLFRQEGYFAVGASDRCEGILSGLEYILLDGTSDNKNTVDISGLKVLRGIYDADIMIFGTDMSQKYDREYSDTMDNLLEPDIKLVIAGKSDDRVNHIVGSNTGSKVILVSTGDDKISGIDSGGVNSFNFTGEVSYQDVYKCMIELFGNDSDANL